MSDIIKASGLVSAIQDLARGIKSEADLSSLVILVKNSKDVRLCTFSLNGSTERLPNTHGRSISSLIFVLIYEIVETTHGR